jgi:ADP-ribose pyrophosphatase
MARPPLRRWKVLGEKTVYRAAPWIRVARQRLRLPDGRLVRDYHRVELADYAVIVARLEDGRLLFERQYKHGIGAVSLTLPGGYLAKGENPLAAAKRELLEEAGARARRWRRLGTFTCNSNYGCGRGHLFLATGVRRVAEPRSGDLEAMEFAFLTERRARAALRRGEVRALSAAAALGLALGLLPPRPS